MASGDSRNLPSGWEARTETKEDGTEIKYYIHLGTGLRADSVDDMLHIANIESQIRKSKKKPTGRSRKGSQFCTRCSRVGHNIFRCPLTETLKWRQVAASNQAAVRAHGANNTSTPRLSGRSLSGRVTVPRTRNPPRCSNCGKRGHNCRSCNEGPKSPDSPGSM